MIRISLCLIIFVELIYHRDAVAFRRRRLDNGKVYRLFSCWVVIERACSMPCFVINNYNLFWKFSFAIIASIRFLSAFEASDFIIFSLISSIAARIFDLKCEKLVAGILQWSPPLDVLLVFRRQCCYLFQ